MKIAIDIDEVLAEFTLSFLPFIKKNKGPDLKYNDMIRYHVWENADISKERTLELFSDFIKSGNLSNLPLSPGCVEPLMELSKSHSLFLLTSRPLSAKESTLSWTKKNFPELSLNVLFSSDPFKNIGNTKADICLNSNTDILIEDNKHYALETAEKGIKTILLDKPWNSGISHKNIHRAKSWPEILEKISQIESKNT